MSSYMQVFEHTAENFAGDVAFFTLALYVSNATGFQEIFVPVSVRMTEGELMQALRQAAHVGALIEIRKWLQSMGVNTNIVSMLRSYL